MEQPPGCTGQDAYIRDRPMGLQTVEIWSWEEKVIHAKTTLEFSSRLAPLPLIGSSSRGSRAGAEAMEAAAAAGGIASHPLCAVPVPCASLARSVIYSRALPYAASRGGGWESQRQLGDP